MEIYSGDEVNICFEEGTTAIVGDELEISREADYINHNDKIVCVPGNLSDTVKTVKMPDSVKHIGGKAFWGFYILSEVQFSSNLETISGGAFLDCENLKTLHLPKSLKIIDARAFGNNKIENIYFDGSIFDMEKIKIEKYHKAFDEIGKVHCTDCVVDFSQDKFYISELEFKGTMDEWKSKINSSWIYKRTAKVICSDGNVIHYKDSDGYEKWTEYDSNGNEIHYKDSKGYEEWYEYDSNGNKIHYKNSRGYENWKEYDSNGKEIHYKNSDGYEKWREYDSNGNEIHYKTSRGYEEWREYDSNGNVIHSKSSDGVIDNTISK